MHLGIFRAKGPADSSLGHRPWNPANKFVSTANGARHGVARRFGCGFMAMACRAKGPSHSSLGHRPRVLGTPHARGLKARSIGGDAVGAGLLQFSGALPQAGMRSGLWPSNLRCGGRGGIRGAPLRYATRPPNVILAFSAARIAGVIAMPETFPVESPRMLGRSLPWYSSQTVHNAQPARAEVFPPTAETVPAYRWY